MLVYIANVRLYVLGWSPVGLYITARAGFCSGEVLVGRSARWLVIYASSKSTAMRQDTQSRTAARWSFVVP